VTEPCTLPLIDVLLPVFNGEATIEESVESVLKQTVESLRVIAIDDGSTDATPKILDALAARDPRVVIVRKPNSGIVDALNLGLSHATAPYVARQDADDVSFPERLERQLAAFEGNPSLVALSGGCVHVDTAGRLTGTRYDPCDPGLADYTNLPSTEPYLLHPFLMVRRYALNKVGGYRHVLSAEDTDLYWRLREIGCLYNLPMPLGKMRLHGESVSNRSLQNVRIMAVHSQLAALSARRRAERRSDIAFSREALSAYRAAPHLRAMLETASPALNEDERTYLKAASAAKLLTLAAGRLSELDPEDCRFVRQAFSAKDLRGGTIANWAYRNALARFGRRGLFAELTQLSDLGVTRRAVAMRLAYRAS
jgi:glycosyltransferase involved in cell wall biosynthesis